MSNPNMTNPTSANTNPLSGDNRERAWLIESVRMIDPSQGLDRVGRLLMVDGGDCGYRSRRWRYSGLRQTRIGTGQHLGPRPGRSRHRTGRARPRRR